MPTATPNFAQTPTNLGGELGPAQGTATQDVLIGATNSGVVAGGGLRIDMLGISNNDSGLSHDVTFTVSDGTNDRLSWTVTVPASAGYVAGTPPVDCLSRSVAPFINDDGAIWLQAGWKLRWAALVAVAAGKVVRCTGFGAAWL